MGGSGPNLRPLRAVLVDSPGMVKGMCTALVLGVLATTGRIVVPLAVRETVDGGIRSASGPRPGYVASMALVAVVGLFVTGGLAYAMNTRMLHIAEFVLAEVRVAAFRSIHRRAVFGDGEDRRGALVSRVTSDIDALSNFLQIGGLMLVLSFGQMLVATVLMSVYSWQLTLLVFALFLPLVLGLPRLQRTVAEAFVGVRTRTAEMMSAVAEAVAGAETIRIYGAERDVRARLAFAVTRHRDQASRALLASASAYTLGTLLAGLVVAFVVATGAYLGPAGHLTLGQLVSFVFLVQLFAAPVQYGTELLNEWQNAVSGWGRLVEVLTAPSGLEDPGAGGTPLRPGPISVEFRRVRFAYPDGFEALHDIDLTIPASARVAVVGETGSGKSTLAALLARLADPEAGCVLLNGVDAREVALGDLRRRVTLVPQGGALFAGDVLANLRWGLPDTTVDQVRQALRELDLDEWVERLPDGLASPVGERGAQVSTGEGQLISLVRAHLTGADLLVLDEATSAVDPVVDAGLRGALDRAARERTLVVIAHRLSTARAAELVVVMDRGQVADAGTHTDLLARCEAYRLMYASWQVHSR